MPWKLWSGLVRLKVYSWQPGESYDAIPSILAATIRWTNHLKAVSDWFGAKANGGYLCRPVR